MLLFFLILIILYLSYLFNKGEIIAPAFVFCASFIFSLAWALAYANRWDLNLHFNTFGVIFGGVLEFFLVSILVNFAFRKTGKNKIIGTTSEKKIEISNLKIIIFIIGGVITILLSAKEVIRLTESLTLSQAIAQYRIASFNPTSLDHYKYFLPKWLGYCRLIVNSGGYWFAYIFAYDLIRKDKRKILSFVAVIVAAIDSAILGSRNDAINMLLAVLSIIVMLKIKNGMFRFKLKFKNIFKYLILAIIVLFSFQTLGNLMGRTSVTAPLDYLAKYCGAEIKNLDIFLQEGNFPIKEGLIGAQTFIFLYRWVGPKIGIKNYYYSFDLPFKTVNGYSLGNVYTTFYQFIYDFGYFGVIILVFIMALISQIIYECGFCGKRKNVPNLWIIIYSYIFSSLAFSFFSNKFFEQNLNVTFFKSVIIWLFFSFLFCKIKINFKSRVHIQIKKKN